MQRYALAGLFAVISVSLALAPFELEGHKVNLLDAPGYADFIGDVGAALQAADLALFVVSAVEGVEVQTEAAWKLAEARGIPRAIFVNKLDRERASFERTLDQLKERFGAGVAPLHLPIGAESSSVPAVSRAGPCASMRPRLDRRGVSLGLNSVIHHLRLQ